jgi:bifunctional DNase/RNase
MTDLTLHAVQWCAQHGHPMMALRTTDDRFFIVAMTAEDAVALATMPDAVDSGRPPRRLHRLIEALIAALGARLTEVQLHVGPDAVLRASLCLASPRGDMSLPAHFADGVALAHHGRLPLRMADEDLAQVPLTPIAEDHPAFPSPPQLPDSPALPGPFQALIDAMDLDDFGLPRRDDGPAGASPFA